MLVLLSCWYLAQQPSAATPGGPSPPAVEDRGFGWSQEWAARRKGKLNSLLEALINVAQEHSDVVEYYTYHPEALSTDGLGQVAGSLLPLLSLLAQEGLHDHRLELSRHEEELMETEQRENGNKSGAQDQPATAAKSEHAGAVHPQCEPWSNITAAASQPRCAGPIPSGRDGRDSSLPFYRFVIVLASAPSHFEYRQLMRDTWLSPSSLGARANNTLVLFAVGQVREAGLENRLRDEHARSGDLLRTPSYDGYRNLSLKVFEGCVRSTLFVSARQVSRHSREKLVLEEYLF